MAREPRLGWRPLDRFAEHGNAPALELVLKAGADPDARDHAGLTALMDAAEAGSAACVELLLRAGADPALSLRGESAADLAAKHGHDSLAATLRAAEGVHGGR